MWHSHVHTFRLLLPKLPVARDVDIVIRPSTLKYEDCGQNSGDYRGLPYSTGYTSLKLQHVIGVFGECYAVAWSERKSTHTIPGVFRAKSL
jgi:hypothetical protein